MPHQSLSRHQPDRQLQLSSELHVLGLSGILGNLLQK